MKHSDKYVVGLGNPGLEYQNTRHNAGFMFLDQLLAEFSFPEYSKKFDGLISAGVVAESKVTLFKPCTFMNNSGLPLLKLTSFYKIKPENIIVVHDDVDLPFGRIKFKQGGGNGGHNGLKSIDNSIGKDYFRLRIGVGKPEFGELSKYVLSKFLPDENITKLLQKISTHFESLLNDNKDSFFHQLTPDQQG